VGIPTSRTGEDIITKFKPQALQKTRIKWKKVGRSGKTLSSSFPTSGTSRGRLEQAENYQF
jgi:hypothetical protein